MINRVHKRDLPDDICEKMLNCESKAIAIDTEAMGLKVVHNRLCVVQISCGDDDAHLVHFPEKKYDAPNLKKVLMNDDLLKIFHFARFDVATIMHYLEIDTKHMNNVACTKILSYLYRTYTNQHSLRALCYECTSINLNKQQQCSNWGIENLSEAQIAYAASDVLYLHKIYEDLKARIEREKKIDFGFAMQCCDFVRYRAKLDISGYDDIDIFSHTINKT